MIQNIKIDTIYYLTASDFEMEFNLGGCCKMRLLTDKADDTSSMVKLLARAVSRSQVILCCGKLFGDDGLINILSKAIKRPLEAVDNSLYGIEDSSEIKIPQNAVPLVNSDGCFCGCILESGPQSIILLTDNKGLRKTVMKPLIHPYIEELSLLQRTALKEETLTNESSEEITEESPAISPDIVKEPEIVIPPVVPETLPISEPAVADAVTEAADILSTPDINENTEIANEPEVSVIEDIKSEDAEEEIPEAVEEPELKTENDSPAISSETPETDEVEIQGNDSNADLSSEKTDEIDNTDTQNFAENMPENPINEVIIPTDDYEPAEENEESESNNPDTPDIADINNGFGLYLEPERVKFSKKSHYALDYTPSEIDETFFSGDEDETADYEYDKGGSLRTPILIITIILLIALAVLVYSLVFLPMFSGYSFSEYVKHIFSMSVSYGKFL